MKQWFKKQIEAWKRPKTWIAAVIVLVLLAGCIVFALWVRRPVAKPNSDRGDAAQVYFAHFALAVDSNRLLFEDGTLPEEVYSDESKLSYTSFAYATVLEVLEDNTYIDPDPKWEGTRRGNEKLLLEITSGEHKGRTIEATVYMNTVFEKYAAEGTQYLILVTTVPTVTDESGNPQIDAAVRNYNRSVPLIILVAVFLLAVGLVGGRVGLRSILGLAFTLFAVIFMLVPALLYHGFSPVPFTLLLCVIVTVVCFLLLDGLNRKTVSAILGTIAGFSVAALFAAIAGAVTHLDGMNYDSQFASYLTQAKYQDYPIRLRGLFVSGIIISALGAVMDVAMSISSSVNELKTVNPDMGFRALFKSGMHIGHDAVGTMTNTLILAFTGGALAEFLTLRYINYDVKALFSSDEITHEIITGISGSVGLILAVPLTALIAAALCGRMNSSSAFPQPVKQQLSRKKKH